MNQPTTQQATPPQAAPAPAPTESAQPQQRDTVDDRAHTLLQQLNADAAETRKTRALATVNTDGTVTQEQPEAAKDADTIRAERHARIEALRKRDREAVDRKEHQAAAEKAQRALEEERRARQAAEEQRKNWIDPETVDEAALFALAERRQIPADRLAAWINEALTNPEKIAAAAALRESRKAIDPQLRAMQERLERVEAERQRERAEAMQAAAYAEEHQSNLEFQELVRSSANTAPFAARLLEKRGPQVFYQAAAEAAAMVPPGAGLQAVLDVLEENLAGLAPVYGATQTPTPSNGTAPPQPRAAAQATTVSNSLAASRASLVEPRDLSKLSLDERADWVIQALERGDRL